MKKTLEIGNAQGFWGDQVSAPARLVKQHPSLDYLTLDYMSEVSMSILAIQKEKDPSVGYAKDFLAVVKSLIPLWKNGSKVKVVSNAGGINPKGCAEACEKLLQESGCYSKRIGVVSGDNVLGDLLDNPQKDTFTNLDTGENIENTLNNLVTANAYLGAKPIVEALLNGADIVITGRVADPSLTVAPCVAHFGWKWNEYDKLAGATIAGHIIECGTQVTGGISTNWLMLKDRTNIGFPIVEVDENGTCIVTKPLGSGGVVNEQTVKEQLLYEIGDPGRYLSPDATVSFLSLHVQDLGGNRVKISGAKGRAPPSTYKVSATFRDGYKAEANLTVFGRHACQKARLCGEIVLDRLREVGIEIRRSHIECIGCGDVVQGLPLGIQEDQVKECVLRIAVADPKQEVIEAFTKEIAPLVTSGPQGITGYTSGRPHIRQVFGYWPCLIDVSLVNPIVEMLEVKKS